MLTSSKQIITMTKNLVFIDSRVADYPSLITHLSAGSEWVLIDGNQDGVQLDNLAFASIQKTNGSVFCLSLS